MLTARSDVVGSLLRPPELLEARKQREAGELTPAEFKRVEDAAVDAALRLQEEAGLDVVTDGEMRRLSFQSQLTEAVDGFGDWDLDAFLWGEWQSDELGEMNVERPPIAVEAPLRKKRFLSAEEFDVRARPHRSRPEGDAPEPEPVRQLLGLRPLDRRVRARWRTSSARSPRSCATRSSSSFVSEPRTSSSTPRTTRC